jgi:hypothetical protein
MSRTPPTERTAAPMIGFQRAILPQTSESKDHHVEAAVPLCWWMLCSLPISAQHIAEMPMWSQVSRMNGATT